MSGLRILSVAEQVADHLRGEITRGRWHGTMPGRIELAKQLGVGITSVEQALRQLEGDGLLAGLGPGRMRGIAASPGNAARRRLRIAILTYEPALLSEGYMTELIHLLWEAGHDAFFTRSSLLQLGMSVKRISKLVKQTEADAWIVCSGPREVTEWFASQPVPAFALFGRRRGLPIASVGPDKSPAYAEATRRLIALGHRKIVLLVRPDRRLPVPGAPERAFLAALKKGKIRPGHYNLPDWEDGIDGFHARLESLFQVTPPTALIVDEALLFVATQQFLSQRLLRVPEEVSLISLEADPAFEWCRPSVAHIRWERRPVIRRVVGWANHIASGKNDRRETLTRAAFIDGGTVGPAPDV